MEDDVLLYEIKNLNCSYDKKKIVLHIEQLCIQKGKIVFFVGRSGIGKTTILETLGFMSNTIDGVNKGETFYYNYNGDDVRNVWKAKDLLSKLRKNFSFIFQQDNLMSNFSASENVMITAMIQGLSYNDAKDRTSNIFKCLGWEFENKPVMKYSGGQRQRLAFARAIISNFSVIFGDEPTGNLDSESSKELMEVLACNVRNKNKATAIIVSHDIPLAVDYADMIVLIQKKQNGVTDEEYGYIDDKSIYKKDEKTGEWSCCGNGIGKEGLCEELRRKLK